MKVFIGYDHMDDKAFKVCVHSLLQHATIPVEIIKVTDRELRPAMFWRPYHVTQTGQKIDDLDERPFSTDFSFTRFAVPLMADYCEDLVLFCDPDMLWRRDIADLMDNTYPFDKAVFCVKHDHVPTEKSKMLGQEQTLYFRKNWSSFMLMYPANCRKLNHYSLNNWTGGDLHALTWAENHEIGALDERWNWLEGWSSSPDPAVVHFTRGTPDMIGNDIPYADEWWAAYEGALQAELDDLRSSKQRVS